MRPRLIATLAIAAAFAGCGGGSQANPTGAGGSAPAASTPAGNPAGSFCDTAMRLEMASADNRQQIQAGLEAATPADQKENVAVIREFMERQAAGNDPYKDPDFLDEYNDAVRAIWRSCGRE